MNTMFGFFGNSAARHAADWQASQKTVVLTVLRYNRFGADFKIAIFKSAREAITEIFIGLVIL
jgi:hypothetical protein